MDPLSVSAAIVGLLSVAAKVTTLLVTLVNSAKGAPQLVQSVLAEVSDISACLGQLQAFLTGSRSASRSRTCLIMVEQVVVILAGCVSAFSELEAVAERLKTDQPIRALERLKWARKEGGISKILRRLQASKSSLNLILAVLTCSSVEEAQASVAELNNLVQRVLESNEDMSRRLRVLEPQPDTPIRQSGSTYRSITETVNGDANTISGNTIGTTRSEIDERAKAQTITQTTNFGFGFEEDLQTSKVYQRISFKHTNLSLPSSTAHSLGWSFLSGVSLADISNISVVSLPISVENLWNAQHYLLKRTKFLGLEEHSGNLASCPRTFRCLLLGPGQAGKSTIMKQLRILHGESFDLEERREAWTVIYDNLKLAFESILKEVQGPNSFADLFELAMMEGCQDMILSLSWDIGREEDFPSNFITSPWQSRAVQKIVHRQDGPAFNDNLFHFMNKINEFARADYVPTDEDILRSWIRTTGIHESRFKTCGYEYHFFETSGEGSERNKWTHVFKPDAYDYLWYVAGLSGYNQCTLFSADNQVKDAIAVLKSVLEKPVFKDVPVILFLNRIDAFKEKIVNIPIEDHFADFKGGSDYEQAVKYFVDRFRKVDRRSNGEMYIYLTNATDVESFQTIIRTVYLFLKLRKSTP